MFLLDCWVHLWPRQCKCFRRQPERHHVLLVSSFLFFEEFFEESGAISDGFLRHFRNLPSGTFFGGYNITCRRWFWWDHERGFGLVGRSPPVIFFMPVGIF